MAATTNPGRNLTQPDGFVPWATKYLLVGMLVSMALLLCKLALEATPFGAWVGVETRGRLIDLLPSFRDAGAQAAVVDISDLAGGTREPTTGRKIPTSREALLTLIEALLPLRPAAIGVDIDFSEPVYGWVDPYDPEFFQRCLEVGRVVPIRLGVWEGLSVPNRPWLTDRRFTPLAAALYFGDTSSGRLPISVIYVGARELDVAANDPRRLLTLGAALAHAAHPGVFDAANDQALRARVERFMFEPVTVRVEPQPPTGNVVRAEEVLVNYSVVRQLRRERIRVSRASDVLGHAEKIQGRIVLIGDVDRAHDRYAVPGLSGRDVPGVLLHAAQAHSLSSEPVREFGHGFRVILDLALPLLIMLLVAASRWRNQKSSPRRASALEGRLLVVAAAAVFVAAAGLVVGARIFWPDFILVIIFLLVHRPTEHRLLSSLQRVWGVK